MVRGARPTMVLFDEARSFGSLPTLGDWAEAKRVTEVSGTGYPRVSRASSSTVTVRQFMGDSAPSEFLEQVGDEPVMDLINSSFMGIRVAIQNVAVDRVTCEISKQRIVMSSMTWTALWEEYVDLQRDHKALVPKISAVVECMDEAASSMKTRVIDVSKVGRPTVPMRDSRRPMDRSVALDRLERVVRGLRDLAGQLAAFGPEDREASPEQVTLFATRYGELREEMRVIRLAVTEAEGNLDVVQAQIVRLMES